MTAKNEQVRILMKERKHGSTVAVASAKAGMSRQTGSKYLSSDKLPSELKGERHWRTRENPFEEVWPQIEMMLRESPDLYASTIFDALCDSHPGRLEEGQLRTLQRHIHRWRALSDADKNYEVFFPQRHRPGEYAQTDFTYTPELQMTLNGEPFEPVLCHVVLPYSNWQWATRCISESFSGLKKGVQAAFFKLGKVPMFHQHLTSPQVPFEGRLPRPIVFVHCNGYGARLFGPLEAASDGKAPPTRPPPCPENRRVSSAHPRRIPAMPSPRMIDWES